MRIITARKIKVYTDTIVLLGVFMVSLSGQVADQTGWTDTSYPSYINKVTDFGERPDWSHDGKRILFVERSFGDVYEYNLETGKYKPLTHHYYHGGYVRALYLSNGDILLSGPKDFPGEDWHEARFRLAELWILDKDLDKPPDRLGEYCWEGPAASRTQLRIAWAQHHGIFPADRRYYELWVGDIDYSSGHPKIINQRVVLNNQYGAVKDMVLEPQNFRPGKEEELTVQAYDDCEVFGLNYETGELINYSRSPENYDEPEGIFPDGEYTLVECSRHNKLNTGRHIDLWKLKLDANNPSWERLTYFNESQVYKATNPVVSDDGRYIAFTVAGSNEVAGIGHGIYLLDLEEQKRASMMAGTVSGYKDPLGLGEVSVSRHMVLPLKSENKYYITGTTDLLNVWNGKTQGYFVYESSDLVTWKKYHAWKPEKESEWDEKAWATFKLRSSSGKVSGPWVSEGRFLTRQHGPWFWRRFDGKLMLTVKPRNVAIEEGYPEFIPLIESDHDIEPPVDYQ